MRYFSAYPNRTLCDAISELRKAYETRNFSYVLGLAEEIQSMANRMEAKLSDGKDIESWTEQRRELKEEIQALTKEVEKLKKEKERLSKGE